MPRRRVRVVHRPHAEDETTAVVALVLAVYHRALLDARNARHPEQMTEAQDWLSYPDVVGLAKQVGIKPEWLRESVGQYQRVRVFKDA